MFCKKIGKKHALCYNIDEINFLNISTKYYISKDKYL